MCSIDALSVPHQVVVLLNCWCNVPTDPLCPCIQSVLIISTAFATTQGTNMIHSHSCAFSICANEVDGAKVSRHLLVANGNPGDSWSAESDLSVHSASLRFVSGSVTFTEKA